MTNEFIAKLEGILRTDFSADLRTSVVMDEIDVIDSILKAPELEDLQVYTEIDVERDVLLPQADPIEEITQPIGKRRIYTEVTSPVSAVKMKLTEVGISLLFYVRLFKTQFPQWLKEKEAILKPDITESEGGMIKAFIQDKLIVPQIFKDFGLTMWFSNRISLYKFLQGFRGLWASYFEKDPLFTRRITTVLNENPNLYTIDQMISIFREIMDKETLKMKDLPVENKRMWTDYDFFRAIHRALTDKGGVGAGGFYLQRMEAGLPDVIFFEGVRLIPYNWRERILKYDPAGANKGRYERRIILTATKNFVLGMNLTADDAFFLEAFYEKKEEANYFKTSYFADTALSWLDYVVVALSARNAPFILPKAPSSDSDKLVWKYKNIEETEFYGGINNSTADAVTAVVGETITVRGSNFTGATAVTVGAIDQPTFTVVNDTTITFVGVAATAAAVSITTPGGTTASAQTLAIA